MRINGKLDRVCRAIFKDGHQYEVYLYHQYHHTVESSGTLQTWLITQAYVTSEQAFTSKQPTSPFSTITILLLCYLKVGVFHVRLENRVSWVRIPPRAALLFSWEKKLPGYSWLVCFAFLLHLVVTCIQGEFHDGVMHGVGRFTWTDGLVYEVRMFVGTTTDAENSKKKCESRI